MPVRHELSRTAAALVTALALVVLPITGTIAPANASVIPSAPGSPTADSDPDGLVDGTDAASAGDSGGSDDSGSGAADGSDAGSEAGTDSADSEAKADDDPDNDEDNACDVPSDGADNSKPCAVEDSLGSTWNAVEKTIRISASEDMPESWVGKEFAGPEKKEDVKRWPVQNSSESADSSTATDAEAEGSTDDSGNPVPEAADEAPDMYSFDENGYVVDADNPGTPMKFTEFEEAPSPEWTFTSDGKNITVEEGEEYPPTPGDEADADKDGSSASDGLEANQDGTVDGTDSASADDDGTNSSDPNSDASSSSDSTDADSSAGESSDSDSTSDSENTASSDSNSSDSAKSDSKDADKSDSADADSAKQTSDSDSSSTSDGSDSGSSDKDGSKDGKDSKDSADKDGSGSTSADGGPIGNDNTPDPSTGNGSSDTRDEIPGDVGNDWMMPGNDDSPPPDYSDPVPQNPDTPVPDDDTDLITGGNTPEPRSDKPPATSFGESIVSTIASSWPIFILAASGMAAVGFIIYLVGRRNKQD